MGRYVDAFGVFTRRSRVRFNRDVPTRARFARRRRRLRLFACGKQHTAAHLAARMEYDNAPYPMMATAEAPSNAP